MIYGCVWRKMAVNTFCLQRKAAHYTTAVIRADADSIDVASDHRRSVIKGCTRETIWASHSARQVPWPLGPKARLRSNPLQFMMYAVLVISQTPPTDGNDLRQLHLQVYNLHTRCFFRESQRKSEAGKTFQRYHRVTRKHNHIETPPTTTRSDRNGSKSFGMTQRFEGKVPTLRPHGAAAPTTYEVRAGLCCRLPVHASTEAKQTFGRSLNVATHS